MENTNSKSDKENQLATVSNNSGESSTDNYELLFLIVKVKNKFVILMIDLLNFYIS